MNIHSSRFLRRRRITLISMSILLLSGFSVRADENDLLARITRLVTPPATSTSKLNHISYEVRILTPNDIAGLNCAVPELQLFGHPSGLTSNRTVIAICGRKRVFIRVYVRATADYWLVRHKLTPGQIIQSDDIKPCRGPLDKVPASILFDKRKIIGASPTRVIDEGHPITSGMIHRKWVVYVNHDVWIKAPGKGFLIQSKGKSLDNAALNDNLRVRTRSGKTLWATATGNNTVTINISQ
ncbi:TPA: flagellar basal body P-ring formation protein FlgA [Salmonella enterica]|uniref:Flagella basal body P-ring formation protein FlgA n=1 Tax=Salmonella enterica TaxID=28901 RepID=A0A757C8E4_SALER|nr:flagella basal body P-ring formation protein FlgA [Salmonella enterica subsp. enterica serovar Richmond]HAG0390749.1 flagellar basal body P-ring formation protein FlgA [Salmonella enterica]